MRERSDRLANALVDRGLDEQARLAILCRNSIEFVEAVLAAEKAGLRASIVNPMAGLRDMEAALRCVNPHAIIANVPAALGMADVIPRATVRVYTGEALGFENYDAFLEQGATGPVPNRSSGIAMPLTSGTTGRPKAIYRKQPHIPPYLRQLLAIMAFDPSMDRALAPCGLQGSGVFNLAVGLPLKSGVGVIVPDIAVTMDLDAEEILRTIEAERVSHLYLPSVIMRRLLSCPEGIRGRYDLGSLKCVLHSGSPCPEGMKSALIDWLGPIVTELYAGAEGGGTLITSVEWLRHRGSVGKAASALVRILSPDHEDLAAGQTGKIYFRSPRHQRFEYFNDAAATGQAYHEDYFTLGDLGYLDADGYLYLTGRTADVIDFSGYNVFPAEIDAALLEHPAVEACAATGVPDDELGEVVGVAVVLRDGHAPTSALTDELLQWCRARLTISKCPRRLVYCKEIAGFAQGKVNRKALRGLFRQQVPSMAD